VNANIRIIPPAYTRKRAYEQTGFDLHVEEGAAIHWEVSSYAGKKSAVYL
jgi:hypothetical protein